MFKIGDKVKWEGKEGTVRTITSIAIGVEFDDYGEYFHDLRGCCENGYGYWIFSHEELILLERIKYHVCNPACDKCMEDPRDLVRF